MAEWLKAADCKSVLIEYGGSNPPLPTNQKESCRARLFLIVVSGVRFEKERESSEPKAKNDERERVQWTLS